MSLWGNKDSKTITGTSISVTQNSAAVTGSGTAFTTDLEPGQYLVISGVEYKVLSITSDTALTLAVVYAGTTATITISGNVTANEKPSYIPTADIPNVYGVDSTEISVGSDNVVNVAIISGGTQYMEAPAVSFSGGGGSSAAATATISGGVVTAIAVSNVGSSYTSAPTVTVGKPFATIATSAVNTSTEVITYNSHRFVTGDAVTYSNGGGSTMGGLTNATVYYINKTGGNTFKLYDTLANAQTGGATGLMDLTGTGNNAQTLTLTSGEATAASVLGSGNKGFHAGWVKKTVGTGGRAGRVQYETLVAMGTITGDAEDINFPDA